VTWLDTVTFFADAHPHWAQPHWAEGACFFASMCLLDDLLQAGVQGELYEGLKPLAVERPTDYGGHYFGVVEAWAVDFTARQFWPDTPFPIVQRLSEYRGRFDRVMPSDDGIELSQDVDMIRGSA
jgi:hypothetical protein